MYFDHSKFIRYATYNTQIHKSIAQKGYQVGTLVYVTSTISINYLRGALVLEIRPPTEWAMQKIFNSNSQFS